MKGFNALPLYAQRAIKRERMRKKNAPFVLNPRGPQGEHQYAPQRAVVDPDFDAGQEAAALDEIRATGALHHEQSPWDYLPSLHAIEQHAMARSLYHTVLLLEHYEQARRAEQAADALRKHNATLRGRARREREAAEREERRNQRLDAIEARQAQRERERKDARAQREIEREREREEQAKNPPSIGTYWMCSAGPIVAELDALAARIEAMQHEIMRMEIERKFALRVRALLVWPEGP
jgi:hypothetical protein